MEVAIPSPAMDFNFDSSCSSPYISAPSSPKRFGEFYSAPASPTRISAFYRDFNNLNFNGSSSLNPLNWEENPRKSKSKETQIEEEDEFEFNFSGQLEREISLTADELFDAGKIRPLKSLPQLHINGGFENTAKKKNSISSPKSHRLPISQGKKIFREAFSPRKKGNFESVTVTASIEQIHSGTEYERGRERVSSSLSIDSDRRGTRSLSPFRDSEFSSEEKQSTKPSSSSISSSISSLFSSSSSSSSKNYRKWKLKDFLLFRSASEGRASEKDPLRKYSALAKKNEAVKNSSFRSIDSSGSVSALVRRGPVSAHELHYTVNRALSEQMKRKTFLPYKQGLLGCLGFNPAVNGLSKGFDSLTRG